MKLQSVWIPHPTFMKKCCHSPQIKRKGMVLLYRKENSELDPYWRHNVCLSHLYLSRKSCREKRNKFPLSLQKTPCKGILTFFLFSKLEWIFLFLVIDQFGLALRSTHSMLNAIASKTFLTSAVKDLTWLLATTTKICTDAWSRKDHSLSPSYLSPNKGKKKCITPAYKPTSTFYEKMISFVGCRLYVSTLIAPLIFKAIAFVRWVFTHSLTDSNFHGHCPNVLIQQHFLWYLIMSVESGTFKTLLSVHPASPILLTKKRSTKRKRYSRGGMFLFKSYPLSHPFKVWQ